MRLPARCALLLAFLAGVPALPLVDAGQTVQDGEPPVAWALPYPAGDAAAWPSDGPLHIVARDEPTGAASLRSYDRDGDLLWKAVLPGQGPWSTPAVGSVVAVMDTGGVVRAYAASTGALLWTMDVGDVPAGFLSLAGSTAGVYAWAADPVGTHVVALNGATGALSWVSRSWAATEVQPRLHVTSYGVYVASAGADGTVWQLAVPDGALRLSWTNPGWRTSLPEGATGESVAVSLARASGAASQWRVQRRWEDNGTILWERTLDDAAPCCPLVARPLSEGTSIWAALPSALVRLSAADGSQQSVVTAQGAVVADAIHGLQMLRASTPALPARLTHVRQDTGLPVYEVPVRLPEAGATLTVFGGGLLATRAVPARLADRLPPGALVVYGYAATAPPGWDVPAGTDALGLDADGRTLEWASVDSLNPAHVRVEELGNDGAWASVALVPDEDFGGPSEGSWSWTKPATRYRVVPIDRMGQEGPPSNEVVTAPLPPPPEPLPVINITIDTPQDGIEVTGEMLLTGRTFWASNGTPASLDVTVSLSPPGGGATHFAANTRSDGAWAVLIDTTTSGDGSQQILVDGDYVFSVGRAWQPCPAEGCPPPTFDVAGDSVALHVVNDQWVTIESIELMTGNTTLVEGDPVVLNVTILGRSGFRPDTAYIGVGHAVDHDGLGPQVVGIGTALAGKLEILEEGGPGGFRFKVTLREQPFPTVHWSEDGAMRVEFDLRQGDRRLPIGSRDVQVHVEPSPDAQERSDRAYASWRARAQELPPGAVVGTAAAATGAVGVGVVVATEVGRYGLLKLLPAGLFSRLRGPQVLEQRRRDSIYQHVQARPGVRLGEVGRALDIPGSALSHHVRTLQREDLVRLVRRGSHLHLFADASAAPLPELAGLAGALLRKVSEAPALTQSEAARRLGVTRQALHYHVRNLHRQGLLDVTVHGRESNLSRTAAAVLCCPECKRTYLGAVSRPCPSCGSLLRPLGAEGAGSP